MGCGGVGSAFWILPSERGPGDTCHPHLARRSALEDPPGRQEARLELVPERLEVSDERGEEPMKEFFDEVIEGAIVLVKGILSLVFAVVYVCGIGLIIGSIVRLIAWLIGAGWAK